MATYKTPIKPFEIEAGVFDELLAKGNSSCSKLLHISWQVKINEKLTINTEDCVMIDPKGNVVIVYESNNGNPAPHYYLSYTDRKLSIHQFIRDALNRKFMEGNVFQIKVVLDGFGEVVVKATEAEMV